MDGHNDLAWALHEIAGRSKDPVDLAAPVAGIHTDLPRLASGEVTASPQGHFEIVNKRVNPTWVNPARDTWGKDEPAMIPPGPDNPLGTRALDLSAHGLRSADAETPHCMPIAGDGTTAARTPTPSLMAMWCPTV